MGIKVFVVGPRFDDAEVCGPSGLLEELDPLEAVVFAACIPVLLDSSDRCGSGCRCDIDIGDRIAAAPSGGVCAPRRTVLISNGSSRRICDVSLRMRLENREARSY
jgi:hypothetical protein